MTQPVCRSEFDDALTHYYRSTLDLAVEIKALKFYLALRRAIAAEAKANFNPNQPRVPRGSADGGQWTRTSSGGNSTPQPRLIQTRLPASVTAPARAGLHATAQGLRAAQRRVEALAEEHFPGGLEALALLPDATTEFVFSLGGDAGRRAYADWVDQSGKVSALGAQILRENLDREISRGTITRQQAEDVVVVAMAATAAGGRRIRRARVGRATTKRYRKTFFEAHPHVPDKDTIVHHAVEQQALNKYPGLFSVEEVHSLENLRGVTKSRNSEVHLKAIRREWNEFYRSHPHAKRKEVLQKATEIDEKYRNVFLPSAEDDQ